MRQLSQVDFRFIQLKVCCWACCPNQGDRAAIHSTGANGRLKNCIPQRSEVVFIQSDSLSDEDSSFLGFFFFDSTLISFFTLTSPTPLITPST